MQKVELYSDLLEAKYDIERHIRNGWKVHTCTMTSERPSYSTYYHILVVYEKEN